MAIGTSTGTDQSFSTQHRRIKGWVMVEIDGAGWWWRSAPQVQTVIFAAGFVEGFGRIMGKNEEKIKAKNEDKPSWLTHSKTISTQKIPTQLTLKPLGNQTHKSRKIYKSALKETNKQTQNSLGKIRCQQTQNSLTPFDDNNSGGFFVSRFCADQSFLR